MNFDPESTEMNFEPPAEDVFPPVAMNAEAFIVQTIMEGSGGPENWEMTDQGLRFVRHLLSVSRPARHGFLPNLKDLDTIERTAREFICRCGDATTAIETMHQIVQQV